MSGDAGDRHDPLLREAAEWLELVQRDDPSTEDLARWQAWLAGSDERRAAFRRVEDLWHAAAQLERHPRTQTRRLMSPRMLAAAVTAVAVGVLFWVWAPWSPFGLRDLSVVETGPGEHRQLALPDGSQLVLGARSAIAVRYTTATRYLVMESGEAYFNVGHDAERPFVVRAGTATITAVGTAFNVRRVEDRVVVTVVEGSVDVANVIPVRMSDTRRQQPKSMRVQAGQEMVYGDGVDEMRLADVGEVTSWQAGRREYLRESLKYVVPDVGRYTTRRIVIADEKVAAMPYTGTVLEGEVDDWLQSLELAFPIEVVHVDDETVVLRSREGK
jgi:transmembrane sensor